MSETFDKKNILTELPKIFRQFSLSKLQELFPDRDINSEELHRKNDYLYSYWMSLIFVAGADIKITFKIHFKTDDVFQLLNEKYSITDDSNKRHLVVDFVKEYCNLVAGSFKRLLMDGSDILLGLSLPVVTSDFDEVFQINKDTDSTYHDYWKMNWKGGSWVCSSRIDIYRWEKLETLKISDVKPIRSSKIKIL